MNIRNSSLVACWLICAGIVGCSSDARRPTVELDTAEQTAEFEKLERTTGSKWSAALDETTRYVRRLSNGQTAPLLDGTRTAESATHEFLAKYPSLFGLEVPEQELKLVRERHDELGMTHARFQQVVNGVPVDGGELSAHFDRDGALVYVNSLVIPDARSVSTTPTLSAEQAYNVAFRDHAKANPGLSEASLARPADTRLDIYVNPSGVPALAYHVHMTVLPSDQVQIGEMHYHVDAHTGAVLHVVDMVDHWDRLVEPGSGPTGAVMGQPSNPSAIPSQPADAPSLGAYTDVVASGNGQAGMKREFHADESGGNFSLTDASRARGKIVTYNQSTLITSSSKDSGWLAEGVDAHYNAEVVFDYYKNTHGRDSIDGAGMQVKSVVTRSSSVKDNATWSNNQMNYGYGSGSTFSNECLSRALDVAAHEMTHGVTQNESGLCYDTGSQCGGLNESLSDIFGKLAEHSVHPDPSKNFIIGWDVTPGGKGIRNMQNPKAFRGNLDTASEVTGSTDVHYSSGIPNVAFALMTAGGTHPTSKVQVAAGLGWEKAGKVWYKSQTDYIKSRATFADTKDANLKAAKDLGLSENAQNIIECAWIAVGVPKGGTCKPITPGEDTGGGQGGAGGGGGTSNGGGPGMAGKAGGGGAPGGAAGSSSGGVGGGSGGNASGGKGGTSTGGSSTGGSSTGGTTSGGSGGASGAGTTGGSGGVVGKAGGAGKPGTIKPGTDDPNNGCGCKIESSNADQRMSFAGIAGVLGMLGMLARRRRQSR